MTPDAPTAGITAVHTIAVPVTDQDKALNWYRDALGLELRFDADLGGGFRSIELAPPGAATSVALVAAGPDVAAGGDTGIRLTAVDTDAAHAALRAAGAEVDDVLRWEGVPPMFTFRDPDGNTLYVTEQE